MSDDMPSSKRTRPGDGVDFMRALNILGRILRFGGIAVLVVATLAMAGTGPLVPGGAQAQSTDERLQIAPADGGPWGRSLNSVWAIDRLLPGESVTGAVLLRIVNTGPGEAGGLFVSAALAGGGPPGMADALRVTELRLGAVDSLWRVRLTCGVDEVTLAVLGSCPVPLAVPDPDGSLFVMTLSLDAAASNVLQGAVQPLFQLSFTLVGEDSADQGGGSTVTPTPAGTPTAPAGGGTPPSPTPTPIDDVAGERTEVPTATPTATLPAGGGQLPGVPNTGTGTVRAGERAWQVLALTGLAMLAVGGVLWFATGNRRR
jgi:hypothetical protein